MRFSPSTLRFSKAGLFGVCLIGALALLLTSVAFAQSDPSKLTGKARAEYERQQAIEHRQSKEADRQSALRPIDKTTLLTSLRQQAEARRTDRLEALTKNAANVARCTEQTATDAAPPKNKGQQQKAARQTAESSAQFAHCLKDARLSDIRARALERRAAKIQAFPAQ